MVRCSPTEFTEYTEFGSVGMAGMPYPPKSVNIRVICGRLFSARSFCVFGAFRGSFFTACSVGAAETAAPPGLAAWVWQGCHTLLICAHPCHLWESFLCKRFCEFRAFCGNLFPPTDFTDLHRYLGCAVLPQNSQNTQNLAAWVWQGCHTLLHLCASVSSVGGSSLQEVLCIRCIPWELLHRLFGCCSRDSCTPGLAAWVWQGCHTLLHLCSSVSSVGVLSLQEVLCIRCIPWELLHRLFCWCSGDSCTPWRNPRK